MSEQVEITEISDGKRIAVATPYHAKWREQARSDLSGRWHSGRKAWTFDARNRSEVSQALRAIFGTDGTTATETVTVRIPAYRHEAGAEIEFAGRTLAKRPSRDDEVQLMPGVILLEGQFDGSGGSMKYPQINADEDVFLKVTDIPKAALNDEDDNSYEILDERAVDLDALRAEKERLLARLAEIDKALTAAQAQA